jgi:trypsin
VTIYQSNICTFYPGGGRGQCNGDSGGAVLVDGQQVGIVSWSEKPCGGPYPGVSTRVAYYRNWIEANTILTDREVNPS